VVARQVLDPPVELGFPFRPSSIAAGYMTWSRVTEILPGFLLGVVTARDEFLVDVDQEALQARVAAYFDDRLGLSELASIAPGAARDANRFSAADTRRALLARGGPLVDHFVPYAYRPFDERWIYWEPETKLLHEKRAELFPLVTAGNLFLVTQQRPRRTWGPPQVVSALACFDLMDRGASLFPLRLSDSPGSLPGLEAESHSDREVLFFHALAIMHSPTYALENDAGLRLDWPRIPVARDIEHSAELGRRVASVLDIHSRLDSGQTGAFGSLRSAMGQPLDPGRDLGVTAHWGSPGSGGICMPSTGKLTDRLYTQDEHAAIAERAELLGISAERMIALLGETCLDVYLNDVAYWRCVPSKVWRYTIGGYQVIKKWLSYRERALLGRDLKPEEARYVTEMVRRIAALVLMQPELDANYERVKADVWEWGK